MKKSALLLTSAAMFAGQLLTAAPTFAEVVDESGGIYWYVPEVVEYGKNIDTEIEEYCSTHTEHNYETCKILQAIPYYNGSNYRYNSYKSLEGENFTITAVNPYRSTIRVFYGGHNTVYPNEPANATEFYVFWTEDSSTVFNHNYVEEILNGNTPEGVHLVISINEPQIEGEEWLKTKEETRFVLPSGSLTGNSKNMLFAILINDVGDVLTANFDYNSRCVNSESTDFEEGMECIGSFYHINDAWSYYIVSTTEAEIDQSLPISPLEWEEELGEPENPEEPEEPEELEEPELRSWTADELLRLEQAVKTEENIVCETDDYGCRWNLYDLHFMSDPDLYQALEALTEYDLFRITAINPTDNSIRAVYRDITPNMERSGDTFHRELEELTIFWSEDWPDMRQMETDEFDFTTNPDIHLLFSKTFNEPYDTDNFNGKEVKYNLTDDHLSNNWSRMIYYRIKNSDGYRIWYADYSMCLDSNEYVEGMDCRLSINQYGEDEYAPRWPKENVMDIDTIFYKESETLENRESEPITESEPEPTTDQEPVTEISNQDDTSTEIDLEPTVDSEKATEAEPTTNDTPETEDMVTPPDDKKTETDGEKMAMDTKNTEIPDQDDAPTEVESEPMTKPEKEKELDPEIEPDLNPQSDKSEAEEEIKIQEQDDIKSKLIGYGSYYNSILTPLTGGTQISHQKCAEDDFIGWVITLTLSSFAFVAWWIFPIKKKKIAKKH